MHSLLRPSSLDRRRWGAESIRELVFGIEDGAVQNMTLIAGMVGAALSNRVIMIAGVVNAMAGVLSMSMGTYLSSKAESDVSAAAANQGPQPDSGSSLSGHTPKRDALVMAASYALGATIPLVPFVGNILGRGLALALAVVLTGATLFLLGVGKAALSRQSQVRSGLEMLGLASAAGLAGYLLGVGARALFGV